MRKKRLASKLLDMYDFENLSDLSLDEYIEGFKKFCYIFEFNYSEENIERLKDIYAFNKLEMKKNADKIIEELKEDLI